MFPNFKLLWNCFEFKPFKFHSVIIAFLPLLFIDKFHALINITSFNSFVPIYSSVLIFVLIRKFSLPLPRKVFIDSVFGPEIPVSPFNPQNESACECHAYDTLRKGFMRVNSVLKKKNSINSLAETDAVRKEVLLRSIVGHRAAGMNAPENSLAGIRKCASRGCTMVEFDVSLTKDKVPVLFHDDNLLRILRDARKLSDIIWEELKNIDISAKFPNERVPTLEEAVELCLSLGMRFIIDLKDEDDQLVEAIVNIFRKYGYQAYSSGVVSSFYFRVIYKIRSRDSNIVGCMAWRPSFFALPLTTSQSRSPVFQFISKCCIFLMYTFNDFAMKHIYWRFLGLSAILVHKDAVSLEVLRELQFKGLRVYAWTVNCPTEKRYFLNKFQIGYLTDTLDAEDQALPAPESWLINNNHQAERPVE